MKIFVALTYLRQNNNASQKKHLGSDGCSVSFAISLFYIWVGNIYGSLETMSNIKKHSIYFHIY